MSVENLVQVASAMWLDPKGIVGVQWLDGKKPVIHKLTGEVILEGIPSYTQVIYRDDSGITGPSTTYLISDWPIARVQAALGLVSADDLEGML